MWDQNMAGKSSGSNSFSNSTNSESYEEWQNDGYWEKEEDQIRFVKLFKVLPNN